MDSPADAGLAPGYSIYRTTIALVLVVAAAILGFLFSSPAASPAEEALASHRCVVAQADLHALELGGRVYIVDEAGQRIFRADAERGAAIEHANARIARHCR